MDRKYGVEAHITFAEELLNSLRVYSEGCRQPVPVCRCSLLSSNPGSTLSAWTVRYGEEP